jgi:hypothetical protein
MAAFIKPACLLFSGERPTNVNPSPFQFDYLLVVDVEAGGDSELRSGVENLAITPGFNSDNLSTTN